MDNKRTELDKLLDTTNAFIEAAKVVEELQADLREANADVNALRLLRDAHNGIIESLQSQLQASLAREALKNRALKEIKDGPTITPSQVEEPTVKNCAVYTAQWSQDIASEALAADPAPLVSAIEKAIEALHLGTQTQCACCCDRAVELNNGSSCDYCEKMFEADKALRASWSPGATEMGER